MKISIACLVLNCMLAAALVVPLQQGGLGIANTRDFDLQRRPAVFRAAEKTGQTGNGAAAQNFSAAGICRTCWPELIAWFGWQLWENSIGHATLALKIGAVFVPAGIAAGWFTGLTGAGVQNSGGEGNDWSLRWRNSRGRDARCAVQTPSAASRHHAGTTAVQQFRPNCDLNFSASDSAAETFFAMAKVVEPLPDMSATSAPFSRRNSW